MRYKHLEGGVQFVEVLPVRFFSYFSSVSSDIDRLKFLRETVVVSS